MPFTVSHAAAVLPFRRTPLPWAALIIGSFGPDFQYFLYMDGRMRDWHYFPHVLTYCLPFTLLVFVAFELVVKQPAIQLLPEGLQKRLDPARVLPGSIREFFSVVAALAIGIATHVLWDSLTHPHTWFTSQRGLRHSFWLPFGHRMYGWAIAQDVSTVVGLAILAWFLVAWYRRTTPTHGVISLPLWLRLTVSALILAGSFVGGWWYTDYTVGIPANTFRIFLEVEFVVSVIGWFLWLLLGYGILTTLVQMKKEVHR